MLDKVVGFFKESYAELAKVTWLGRQELIGSTIVIMILIGILSVVISFFDFVCLKLVRWIL